MGLSHEEYRAMQRKCDASRGKLKADCAEPVGLCSSIGECIEGDALVFKVSRKKAGGEGSSNGDYGRYRITFRIRCVRPLDWDNYRIKDIQDCIVKAGLLPDDNWRVLQGCVISEKAHHKEEERTEITIERL